MLRAGPGDVDELDSRVAALLFRAELARADRRRKLEVEALWALEVVALLLAARLRDGAVVVLGDLPGLGVVQGAAATVCALAAAGVLLEGRVVEVSAVVQVELHVALPSALGLVLRVDEDGLL